MVKNSKKEKGFPGGENVKERVENLSGRIVCPEVVSNSNIKMLELFFIRKMFGSCHAYGLWNTQRQFGGRVDRLLYFRPK